MQGNLQLQDVFVNTEPYKFSMLNYQRNGRARFQIEQVTPAGNFSNKTADWVAQAWGPCTVMCGSSIIEKKVF